MSGIKHTELLVRTGDEAYMFVEQLQAEAVIEHQTKLSAQEHFLAPRNARDRRAFEDSLELVRHYDRTYLA